MIEGGGLGVVAPDEVGPMSIQVPNGVVDLLVEDEAAAVAAARRYLSYFGGSRAGTLDVPHGDQRLLRHFIPANRLRSYDVRPVIKALCDSGSVLELRAGFGIGVVTALARIGGHAVGLLASNPRHLGGAIDGDAADKAAAFLGRCEAGRLPVVSLADTPGFMVGPAAERTAIVRRFGAMFVAGARFTVPVCAVVLRKAYGLGAMAMAAGDLRRPAITVAWPTGEFGGMGLEGATPAPCSPTSWPAAPGSADWWPALGERGVEIVVDDGKGQVGELDVLVAGVQPQGGERGHHGHPVALREDTFRLFDDDPAVECALEVLGQHGAAVGGALLQDADGGDVRQRLRQPLIVRGHRDGAAVEQVQPADRLLAQPHGQRHDGPETSRDGVRREQRPASEVGLEVGADHGRAGADALQTRSLVVLQLEDLQQPGFLTRGRDHGEVALLVVKQQASRCDAQQANAGCGQPVKQVDDVVVLDEAVREHHEGPGEFLLAVADYGGRADRLVGLAHRSSTGKRRRRSTTSFAISATGRLIAKACARNIRNASSMVTPAWIFTMPLAWCTCIW